MSWLYSRALVEACLHQKYSDGAPWLQWNIPTGMQAYSPSGRTMEFWNLSRFGMTCGPLTAASGEALLISFLGGFPCQAFSSAARGRNIAEKDLWPEMLRVVCEVEPRFVFGENVSKKAIDRACDDLEPLGYKTRAISLSAQDLGADHIRERHWLLAYADDKGELLRGIDAEVAGGAQLHYRVWEAFPHHPRMADGVANRVERYTATGNGQVPVVAVAALLALACE